LVTARKGVIRSEVKVDFIELEYFHCPLQSEVEVIQKSLIV